MCNRIVSGYNTSDLSLYPHRFLKIFTRGKPRPDFFQKPETFFKSPDFQKSRLFQKTQTFFKNRDFTQKPRLYTKTATLHKNRDFFQKKVDLHSKKGLIISFDIINTPYDWLNMFTIKRASGCVLTIVDKDGSPGQVTYETGAR